MKRVECNNLQCFELLQSFGDKSDVYVTFEWCGTKAETTVQFEAGNNPVFEDELVLVPNNVTDNKLIVKVFDKNKMRADVLIGQAEIMMSYSEEPVVAELFNPKTNKNTGNLTLQLFLVSSEEADQVVSLMLEKISSEQKAVSQTILNISNQITNIVETGNYSSSNLSILASELPKLVLSQNTTSTVIQNISSLTYQISSSTGVNADVLRTIKEDQIVLDEEIKKISSIVTNTDNNLTTELPKLVDTQNETALEVQKFGLNQTAATEALKKIQADQSFMSSTLNKLRTMGMTAAASYLGFNLSSVDAIKDNNVDKMDALKLQLIQQQVDEIAQSKYELPTLVVSYMECKRLKNVELFGKNDVYMVVEWYDKQYKTAVLNAAGQSAVYENLITLSPTENHVSTYEHKLTISVYDRNVIRSDELIGKAVIQLSDSLNSIAIMEADIYDKKGVKSGAIKLNVVLTRPSHEANNNNGIVQNPSQVVTTTPAGSKDFSAILESIQKGKSLYCCRLTIFITIYWEITSLAVCMCAIVCIYVSLCVFMCICLCILRLMQLYFILLCIY